MDGHEENTLRVNLIWTCRRCNVRCGNTLGGRTRKEARQYNPSENATGGAKNLGQWIENAVMSMKGDPGGNMAVGEAVAMIHATPPDARSDFAKQIWSVRESLVMVRSGGKRFHSKRLLFHVYY